MKFSKVTTRKQMIKVITDIAPLLNKDGEEIANYWLDALEGKEMQVKEIKTGFKADLKEGNFKSEDAFNKALEMLEIMPKEEAKVEEEPKAETKQEAKGDDKKQKPNAKEQAENIKLVGYRYTRPMFPEVLHDLEGYMLTRVDTNDQKELEEIGEENLVVAVFFPEWESGTYIDPTDLVDDNIADILQAHGLDSFPNRLDLQQVLHLDSDIKVMATLSFYTELPYTMSIKDKWFKVDKTLHCRVNNFGHDYAFYKAEKIK